MTFFLDLSGNGKGASLGASRKKVELRRKISGGVVISPTPTPTPTPTPSSAPANTVAPTLSATTIVGQLIELASLGTWSNSPTSFVVKLYNSTGTLKQTYSPVVTLDDVPAYQFLDIEVGEQFKYGVVATNAIGSSAEVFTTTTAAVTQIDLTGQIALTRLSASGDPFDWTITLGVRAFPLYEVRFTTYAGSAGAEGTEIQDVTHLLTVDDFAGGVNWPAIAAAEGLTTVGSTQYLKAALFTTSPDGNPFFQASALISPTDVFIYATWDPLNDTGIALTNGNKTATRSGANGSTVRTTKSHAGKHVYYEVTLNSANLTTLAIIDSTVTMFGSDWTPEMFSGGPPNPHACAIFSSNGNVDYNGTLYSAAIPGGVNGDVICIDHNEPAKTVRFRLNGGTWSTAVDISAMTAGASYLGFQGDFGGGQVTVNAGESGFAFSVPSGAGPA